MERARFRWQEEEGWQARYHSREEGADTEGEEGEGAELRRKRQGEDSQSTRVRAGRSRSRLALKTDLGSLEGRQQEEGHVEEVALHVRRLRPCRLRRVKEAVRSQQLPSEHGYDRSEAKRTIRTRTSSSGTCKTERAKVSQGRLPMGSEAVGPSSDKRLTGSSRSSSGCARPSLDRAVRPDDERSLVNDNGGDGSCERGEGRESEQGEGRESGEEHGGRGSRICMCV